MNQPDPNCPFCHGSGIDPASPIDTISVPPYCTDPASLEPCECVLVAAASDAGQEER